MSKPNSRPRPGHIRLEPSNEQRVRVDFALRRLVVETDYRVKEEAGAGLQRILGRAGDPGKAVPPGLAEDPVEVEKRLILRAVVGLSAEEIEALEGRALSPLEAARHLERGPTSTEVELRTSGRLGGVAFEGRKVAPARDELLAQVQELIDDADRSWHWSATVWEARFVELRGSFAEFFVALAHRLAQNDRETNLLLARRARGG